MRGLPAALAGLAAALERSLGAAPVASEPVGGGSINAAYALRLADGRRVFVKTGGPPDMYALEARGLAFLAAGLAAEPGPALLRLPRVLAAEPGFLALELLEPGPARRGFELSLGRGLARLHRSGAQLPGFGLDHDNYIGSEAQPNQPLAADWPSFYRDLRLGVMLERARGRGLVSPALGRSFDALFARLSRDPAELCGDPEPPARLHGDLWAGNLHRDASGAPVLVDPAVYAGHREVDLAMMRLFGGFGPRVFAAYAEVWPLQPGWERRVDLYQLYPLLVHVVLFGASYLGSVRAALGRLLGPPAGR